MLERVALGANTEYQAFQENKLGESDDAKCDVNENLRVCARESGVDLVRVRICRGFLKHHDSECPSNASASKHEEAKNEFDCMPLYEYPAI